MLLYSSVAGMCKDVPPAPLVVISALPSSINVDPSTVQIIEPLLELQLKVAVDPSVELTDVGMLMKAEEHNNDDLT